MKAAYNSPAGETLLSILQPLLNDSVIVESNISVPGVFTTGESCNRAVDVLLVGEYETVAIVISGTDTDDGEEWSPRHPLGLLTEVYTLPAVTMFFHLDDFAYLFARANPSLFVAGAQQTLRDRASQTIRGISLDWLSGPLSVAYPARDRVDLDIRRQTSIHHLDSSQTTFGRAA